MICAREGSLTTALHADQHGSSTPHQTQPQRSSQAVQVRAEKQPRGCFCQTLGCQRSFVISESVASQAVPWRLLLSWQRGQNSCLPQKVPKTPTSGCKIRQSPNLHPSWPSCGLATGPLHTYLQQHPNFDHAIVGAIDHPSFKSVQSCGWGFEVRARVCVRDSPNMPMKVSQKGPMWWGATFPGYTEHCGFPSLLTKLRGLAWNFVIGGTSMEWGPSLSCTDCFTCQVFSTTGFTPVVLIQPHPTSFRFPKCQEKEVPTSFAGTRWISSGLVEVQYLDLHHSSNAARYPPH